MQKHYIRKIADYSMVGGFGAVALLGLSSCESSGQNDAFSQASTQNAFVVIDELPNGSYKIAEEYPAPKTTIIVRKPDGSERVLSKEEIDALVKQEAKKIDSNTSSLTNSSIHDGLPGLGSVLLSSIAGAVIGSWIGNKLFNNPNFQSQRQNAYKSPSAFNRSVDSFKNTKASPNKSSSTKKSGFFSSSKKTSSGSSFGG